MINLDDLTPQQREQLTREVLESQREKQAQKEEQRKSYKEMTAEKVSEVFPLLMMESVGLAELKKHVFKEFCAAISLKNDLYDVKDLQQSHTFMNADGTQRITLGTYQIDSYDDTVNEGISIVKEHISSLARDENSRALVDTVLKLMAKNKSGALAPSRVMQLRQLANRTADVRFLEGVKIIEDSYKPQPSKQYIKAEIKDDMGAWKSIPLGITEAQEGVVKKEVVGNRNSAPEIERDITYLQKMEDALENAHHEKTSFEKLKGMIEDWRNELKSIKYNII